MCTHMLHMHKCAYMRSSLTGDFCLARTSAYVSIRQHTSAFVCWQMTFESCFMQALLVCVRERERQGGRETERESSPLSTCSLQIVKIIRFLLHVHYLLDFSLVVACGVAPVGMQSASVRQKKEYSKKSMPPACPHACLLRVQLNPDTLVLENASDCLLFVSSACRQPENFLREF